MIKVRMKIIKVSDDSVTFEVPKFWEGDAPKHLLIEKVTD